jgi:hypothetical protein
MKQLHSESTSECNVSLRRWRIDDVKKARPRLSAQDSDLKWLGLANRDQASQVRMGCPRERRRHEGGISTD